MSNVILCRGFSPEVFPIARAEGGFGLEIPIIGLGEEDLGLTMAEILSNGKSLAGENPVPPDPAESNGQYFVIIAGERSLLEPVMKGFKAAIKAKKRQIIFAWLTETAKDWKLSDYLQELSEEHRLLADRSKPELRNSIVTESDT